MYQLFESIRSQGGKLFLMDYHQKRMAKSYRSFYGNSCPFVLDKIIQPVDLNDVYKIQFFYDESNFKIKISLYQSKIIETLKLIEIGEFNYGEKRTNWTLIDHFFEQRENCDDILMLKKGWLTDLSYANILLWNGTHWVTPADPLLHGVQRQYLLDQQKIIAQRIHKNELNKFSHFQWINALNPFDFHNRTSLRCEK